MKTSSVGRALIRLFEQCRLTAYLPTPDDVWTIGFGTTLGVHKGDVITLEQAEEFLTRDLGRFEFCISDSIDRPLSQNQFDALVCFAYNIGCAAFRGSTLRRMLQAGDISGAADQFLRWDKQAGKTLKGLTRRRQAERGLFLHD